MKVCHHMYTISYRFWTLWRRGRGRFARRGRGQARLSSDGGWPLRTAPLLRTRRRASRRFASCFAQFRDTCSRERQRGKVKRRRLAARDAVVKHHGWSLWTAPLWTGRRDSRRFASCFAPVRATCSCERHEISKSFKATRIHIRQQKEICSRNSITSVASRRRRGQPSRDQATGHRFPCQLAPIRRRALSENVARHAACPRREHVPRAACPWREHATSRSTFLESARGCYN